MRARRGGRRQLRGAALWRAFRHALRFRPAASVFAKVWNACSSSEYAGRTVTVKLEYADFQQVTRSRSHAGPIAAQTTLERISLDLLGPLFPPPLGVRLLGVTLSSLKAERRTGPAKLALGLG